MGRAVRESTARGSPAHGDPGAGDGAHADPADHRHRLAPAGAVDPRGRATRRARRLDLAACDPAALHTGVGSDVQRGIATVVVGGLAIATLLTLFVLPSMYHVIEHGAERRSGPQRWA